MELLLPRRPRPGSVTAVQRTPTNKPTNQQTNKPTNHPPNPLTNHQTTPTEVGPLPTDLWELIGQKPPEAPEPENAARSTQHAAQNAHPTIQRAPAEEAEKQKRKRPFPPHPPPPTPRNKPNPPTSTSTTSPAASTPTCAPACR
ncbi:MAG: hypothetical protein IPJ94_04210 [Chloroflexi bacterium]|nr:hypothetical protein [Chloroflexota bacterium]